MERLHGWHKLALQSVPVETTSDAVRRARERLGLSRKALADASGVSERTINRIEAGIRTSPRSTEPVLRYLKLGDHQDETAGRGPLLHEASHVELLAELARRIAASDADTQSLPPVPQVKLSWPRGVAPSAQRIINSDETEQPRSTAP